MKCGKCGYEITTPRSSWFASQDTYALSQQLTNLRMELHMLTHVLPIGANL